MTQFHGILMNPRDLFKRRSAHNLIAQDTLSEDLTHDPSDGSDEQQNTRRNSNASFGDLMMSIDD